MLNPEDFSRLLNGNDPPNAGESASIQLDLNSLKLQITQLETQLAGLREQERARLAILSPVRSVPAEILGEIFTLALPPILDEIGRCDLVNLSLVCRRWRNASLSTHRLWGGVKIFLYHVGNISYNKITSWLARSGTMPKTAEFRSIFGCRCPEMPCHSANPTLRRLVTEGPALEHLKLPCKDANCFKNWISAIQSVNGPTPWHSLTSLHLAFEEHVHWNDAKKASHSIFRHLPQTLLSLHLQLPSGGSAFRTEDDQYNAVIHIPKEVLRGLKSLAIFCDWSGMHIFHLLQECADLETLQVDIDDCVPWEDLEESDDLQETPLKLAKLRTLRFRRAATIDFLLHIKAPALRHLDLGCTTAGMEDEEDDEFAQALESFVLQSRLQNKLETLRIYDIYVPADELGVVLSHLRKLRQLTLDRVKLDNPWAFWSQFWNMKSAPGADTGACLPFLERLNLLNLPAKYPFISLADFLSENKKRVPCQVIISYEAGGQYTTSDFDERPFNRTGATFKVVPPEPSDEGYYCPCGERDFV